MRNATIRMKHYSACSEFSSINITRFNESDPSSDWQNLTSLCSGDYIYANTSGFSVFGVAGSINVQTLPPSTGGGPIIRRKKVIPIEEVIEEILPEEVQEVDVGPAKEFADELIDSAKIAQIPIAPLSDAQGIPLKPSIFQSMMGLFSAIAAIKVGSLPVGKAALGGSAVATAAGGMKLATAKFATAKALSVSIKEKLLGLSTEILPIPFVIGRLKHKFDHPVLENEFRIKIFKEVIQNPGIHFREIQRRVEASSGTTNWHIKILESANLIKPEKTGYYKAYYPAKGVVEEAFEDYIHNPTRRGIMELVISMPGMTQTEIAERIDIHPSTVLHHIKQLVESGVIAEVRDGKMKKYFSLIRVEPE
jgi:predicted transcriptional regulator